MDYDDMDDGYPSFGAIMDHVKERLKERDQINRDLSILENEITRWKQGHAQDDYDLYNLPSEYGGGISAMRDWVIKYLEKKVEDTVHEKLKVIESLYADFPIKERSYD